ncbi:hypothetical protein [Nocardiopsis dassonvillei]|uniref:hypothetical protein n=1 Tax=Nocardiopsis dassonvillei TaxID=2014 RepID=UPI00362A0A3E
MEKMFSSMQVFLDEANSAWAVKTVQAILGEEPDLTGAQVLARLKEIAVSKSQAARDHETANAPKRSTCRRCGFPVQTLSPTGPWRHEDGLRAGCRAASFDRLGTWDDTLDRSWKATPTGSPS